MNSQKKYLFKLYISVFMYIFTALFILYLTYRAVAATPTRSNIFFNTSTSESATKSTKPVVIIDAGHGGIDGGAEGFGNIIEKDINLAITLKLKRLFKISNCEVILTRETDISLNDDGAKRRHASDLSNRVKIANKYPNSIFISIHMNKFPQENTRGMQIFFSENNLDSANLAELLKANNKSYLQPENNKAIKRGKDIYVLENVKTIAILIECGFLSNQEESRLLTRDDYQNRLAKIIFASVAEFERTF